MILVVGLSLIAGGLLGEASCRVFGSSFQRELGRISLGTRAFRDAQEDDERQRHLLRTGMETLRLGVRSLLGVAALALLAGVAPVLLSWSKEKNVVYAVIATVAATAWWLARAARHRAAS